MMLQYLYSSKKPQGILEKFKESLIKHPSAVAHAHVNHVCTLLCEFETLLAISAGPINILPCPTLRILTSSVRLLQSDSNMH